MAWIRLEDTFPEHQKIDAAGGDAAWLHVCGIGYCNRNRTDGFIPAERIRRLSDRSSPGKLAEKLVEVGLWEHADGGYLIHDYLEYNPTRAELEAEEAKRHEKKAQAGRLGGIASGISRRKHRRTKHEAEGEAEEEAEGKQNEAPTRPDPTYVVTTDVTDDSQLPGPSPSPSFNASQRTAHQLARHQCAAKAVPPVDIGAWIAATRKGILEERPDEIAARLAKGMTPDDAAYDMALRPVAAREPLRRFEPELPHPATCQCDGIGLIQNPDDESRTAASVPCPQTEWPEATIHQLRRAQ